MTGQQDQPTLPDTSDQVTEAARALPGRPDARVEPPPDRTAPRDRGRIDRGHASSVNEQLLERMWRLPPGHPSSPYDGDGKLRPPVPDYRQFERPLPGEDGYDGPEPAWREPVRLAAGEQLPELANEQSGRPETYHGRSGTQQERTGAAPDRLQAEHGERGERGPEPGRPRPAEAQGDPFTAIDGSAEGDAAADTWRRALPGLQDTWQKHEEKWPESERPPADRSQDEPGSWRGDNGHYLNAEENLVSGHAMGRVSEVEKKTTPTVLGIKAEVPGADLAGFENRLKGENRFKEKVAEELRAKPERPIGLISESMPDAMRYTYQLRADKYASSYWDIHRSLADQGYSLDLRRNSWDNSQYKGLNTRWRSPEGQLFEIQFHTPESFEAKQLTHKAYERIRSPVTSDRERDDLYKYQAEVSRSIPTPNGALTIPDYRKERT